MSKPPVHLRSLVQRRLALYLNSHPDAGLPEEHPTAVRVLTELAKQNFQSDRYTRYREHRLAQKRLTPTQYLDQLIETWICEAPFVTLLKQEDADAWHTLLQDLTHTAAKMLRGFPSTDTSEDYAQRACAQILVSPYPFDIPFLRWARTITQHLVLARGRSKDRFNDEALSLDVSPNPLIADADEGWAIPDTMAQLFLDAVSDRDVLVRLLRRLNDQRLHVIVASYLLQQDDAQTAAELGIKEANVQTIRHRALNQLLGWVGKSVSVKPARRHRIDKKRNNSRKRK